MRESTGGEPFFRELKDLHSIGLTAKTINNIKHLNSILRLTDGDDV